MIALFGALSGCAGEAPPPPADAALPWARASADTGVALFAYSPAPTITTPDSLRIGYGFVNSGPLRTINIQPDWFRFVLVTGNRRHEFAVMDDVDYGDGYLASLDPHGFAGREVALAAAFDSIATLLEPGAFEVFVVYSPPPEPSDSAGRDAAPAEITSNSVRMLYRPPEEDGRRPRGQD